MKLSTYVKKLGTRCDQGVVIIAGGMHPFVYRERPVDRARLKDGDQEIVNTVFLRVRDHVKPGRKAYMLDDFLNDLKDVNKKDQKRNKLRHFLYGEKFESMHLVIIQLPSCALKSSELRNQLMVIAANQTAKCYSNERLKGFTTVYDVDYDVCCFDKMSRDNTYHDGYDDVKGRILSVMKRCGDSDMRRARLTNLLDLYSLLDEVY